MPRNGMCVSCKRSNSFRSFRMYGAFKVSEKDNQKECFIFGGADVRKSDQLINAALPARPSKSNRVDERPGKALDWHSSSKAFDSAAAYSHP